MGVEFDWVEHGGPKWNMVVCNVGVEGCIMGNMKRWGVVGLVVVAMMTVVERGECGGGGVAILGDSLGEGMVVEFRRVVRLNGYESVEEVKAGTRIDYWVGRIEGVMARRRPRVVVVSLGTNDSGMVKPEVQGVYVERMRGIVERYGGRIVWILPGELPRRFVGQGGIRRVIIEKLSPRDVVRVDGLGLEKARDGIHLTKKGYADLVGIVWKKLVGDGSVVEKK